jgi:hypothetical protein
MFQAFSRFWKRELHTPEMTMTSFVRLFTCLFMLLVLGGCSSHPVRHLASDASLVKLGVSSKEDVLTFLGDPDARQMISASVEKWIYYEEEETTSQKMPYLGKLFSSDGFSQIVITFEGNIVSDSRYSSFDSDDFDWSDDYSWQEPN